MCPLRYIPALITTLVCLLLDVQSCFAKSANIHKLVESTKLQNYSDITFFLRLPKQPLGVDENTRTAGRKGQAERGVLALCTHRTEPRTLKSTSAKTDVSNGSFSSRTSTIWPWSPGRTSRVIKPTSAATRWMKTATNNTIRISTTGHGNGGTVSGDSAGNMTFLKNVFSYNISGGLPVAAFGRGAGPAGCGGLAPASLDQCLLVVGRLFWSHEGLSSLRCLPHGKRQLVTLDASLRYHSGPAHAAGYINGPCGESPPALGIGPHRSPLL